MPDLWDSGPSLPPPGGPQQNGPERSSPDTQGQSAAVQHIDGAAYRTGALAAHETPFPFEQVERGLDAKLAGVYGADAVPAVRGALHDAVSAEGVSAYDRFRSDPGAFGEVHGDTAGADRLGRELREVEVYRAYCVAHGSLVPVEAPPAEAPAVAPVAETPGVDTRSLRPSGVYITGPDAETVVRALDRHSALDLSRDAETGRIVAAPITVEEVVALGVQDRWLLRALQGWKTDVTLETTRADTAPDLDGVERQLVIGRYDGSRVDAATEQIEARQVFNLRHAQVLERYTGASVGGSVAHEIIEAYAGARGRPWRTFEESYDVAHEGAEALDPPPDREWGTGVAPDRRSDQIVVSLFVDTRGDASRYEREIPLYVDPTQHFRLDATGAPVLGSDGRRVIDSGPPRSLTPPPPRDLPSPSRR